MFKEKVGTFVPGEKPTKETRSCSVFVHPGTGSHNSLTFTEQMDSAAPNILKERIPRLLGLEMVIH